MILLKATTEILEITTSSAAAIDYSVSYADITTSTFSPSTSEGKISSATDTTILSAPSASTQRQVKLITITNRDAAVDNTILVKKDISGTEYHLTPVIDLLAGETMQYSDVSGWTYYSVTGAVKGGKSAAGINNQIQFNNGGVLAGDVDFTWDSTNNQLTLNGTDAKVLLNGITNEPAAPSTGNLLVYAKAISGKMQLKIKGPSGLETPLQAALWSNNVIWWTPGAAAGVYTGTVGANLGTAAAILPTTVNLYTAMRRSTFASIITTANQQVGARTENMFFRGAVDGMGGFMFTCRFGLNTWTAGDRLFVGLCQGTTAVVTVQPSSLFNTLGFCIDAGDTAITFLHCDSSSASTKDTISGQPTLASLQGYDAYIWCAPNDSTVYYRLDDVLTGNTIVDTSTNTNLPANTTMLTAQAIMGNAANTASAGLATIGVARMYIETDR
jgi:hypothetical protein